MKTTELVWKIVTRGSDALVVGGAAVTFAGWGAYEWVGQRFNYYDAPLICAGTAVGLPLTLAGSAYLARRGWRTWHGRAWHERENEDDTTAATAVPAPDSTDWVNTVQGLQRARRPVFPIGRSARGGLVGIDFNETPHLIVNGQTGSGKTMAVLRPLAAAAALSGLFQVVILDKSGRNFRALEAHPNIHLIRYDHESLPDMAESIYAEILRRDRWLAAQPDNPTTLDRARADRRPPRILVIIDEYANAAGLLRETNPRLAGKLTSSMIQIVQEGRAMSVHLVLAAQRPDHTQVNTTLRSQLNGLTFHMRDATDAKLADAPGAEELPAGQAIFSKPDGRSALTMFYPSDEQLRQALAAAPARDCGAPTWLAGYAAAAEPVTEVVTEPVTAVIDPVTGAVTAVTDPVTNPVSVTDPPSSVTSYSGRNRWDLGTTAVSTRVAVADNGPVTAVTTVTDRVCDFLADDGPAPIAGLTIGQAQAIAYCLLSGESLTATVRLVFNGKNGRYFDLVKEVRAGLTAVLGAGE